LKIARHLTTYTTGSQPLVDTNFNEDVFQRISGRY